MIKELQAIDNREQLVAAVPKLRKLFDDLVEVMIGAREYQYRHPSEELLELTKKNHNLSEKMRLELERIYRMEGGRDLIEKIQQAPLERLDLFEKELEKRKSQRLTTNI